jgi:hypothetical protein
MAETHDISASERVLTAIMASLKRFPIIAT